MSWPDIEHSIAVTRCRCPLRPSMTREQLAALGGGCRMPNWACNTLVKYRRLLPDAPLEPLWTPEASQVRVAESS